MGKKVLIITYYWPPSGGGGVQRWLKFAKYLPEFGWEPIIFTPENPDFDQKDPSLLKDISPDLEVLKFPIWEPYKIFKKLSGKKELKQGQVLEDGKKSLLGNLAVWIRGNLFIPDPRRFWVKSSVEYLDSILKTNDIKTVITTGPPHSMHLIGMKLRMKSPTLNWVADFRDPWSDWDILDKLKLSQMARKKHRKLEEQVFKVSSRILTVSESWKQDFKELGARNVHVVTNGFDESDIPEQSNERPDKFRICHVGMLNRLRNPEALWEVLSTLVKEDSQFGKDLEINLIGILSVEVTASLKSYNNLAANLKMEDYLPHNEVYSRYNKAAVLLLILNQSKNAKGHLPGKLFEYISVGRPIIGLGDSEGDANNLLRSCDSGKVIDTEDIESLRKYVLELYKSWKSDEARTGSDVSRFTRRNLTGKLASLLNDL